MLKSISDSELRTGLLELVQKEKKITAEIVSYIAEVDRRRLFLEWGFTSLFQFLTSLGYAPASAQRRIDAARLHNQIPVSDKIESGELNLTQISILAQGLRRKSVGAKVKSELVSAIQNLDVRQTEIAVHQILDIPVVIHDQKHFQKDGSVRVEITFSKEQWQMLNRVKEVSSHIDPNPNLAALIERLSSDFLSRHDPTSDRKLRRVNVASRLKPALGVSAANRRAIFKRDRFCQWRHADGRICGSGFQSQIDHKQSRSEGGNHQIENLQLLCGVHNRLKYRNSKRTKVSGVN